eukprot:m.76559 g.76559  ORF g.76559 m.76559 type:complete len:84 (-) comp12488_c0_seq3:181-432(-)
MDHDPPTLLPQQLLHVSRLPTAFVLLDALSLQWLCRLSLDFFPSFQCILTWIVIHYNCTMTSVRVASRKCAAGGGAVSLCVTA